MAVIIGGGSGNAISINGTVGTSGQVIVSDGTNSFWGSASASAFPAGTLMLFQQTAAPTGWTKQTTHDNKALRVVSGSASSGGSTAFTSVFTSRTPAGSVSVSVSGSNSGGGVSNTTLGTGEVPAHSHQFRGYGGGAEVLPDISMSGNSGIIAGTSGFGAPILDGGGSGGAHGHGFTPPSWSGSASGSFSGAALDFAVQYVDLIIASKA